MRSVVTGPDFVNPWNCLLEHEFLRTVALCEVARNQTTNRGLLMTVICFFATWINDMNVNVGVVCLDEDSVQRKKMVKKIIQNTNPYPTPWKCEHPNQMDGLIVDQWDW